MCKEFSKCKAKDMKEIVGGELQKRIKAMCPPAEEVFLPEKGEEIFGQSEVLNLIDAVRKDFPKYQNCKSYKSLGDGKFSVDWGEYVGEIWKWVDRWWGK